MLKWTNRFKVCFATALAVVSVGGSRAAVPPAEQLLPADTLAVFTIPDWGETSRALKASPFGQLWRDPAMRSFKEHVTDNFKRQFLTPLERELDAPWQTYLDLVQGQVTLALLPNNGLSLTESPGFILLIDAEDKSEALDQALTKLRSKWTDAGKPIKTQELRGASFSTLIIEADEVEDFVGRVLPDAGAEDDEETDESGDPKKTEITFGRSDSLFIAATDPNLIETILARRAGGSLPALAEQGRFQRSHAEFFRSATAYGWIHFEPIFKAVLQATEARRQATDGAEGNPLPSPARLLGAIGLDGLKAISLSYTPSPAGSSVDFFLDLPESERQGLFQILAPESKDASPPRFVPSDVVKFSRWRINGKETWATIERTLERISPDMARSINLALSFLGKDRDPNFDLKQTLIGNLGDDFISFQKGSSSPDTLAPPTVWLIGSPEPAQLARGLRTAAFLIPGAAGQAVEEREFLGRTVYSLPLTPPGRDTSLPRGLTAPALHFSAAGGYLAVSTDVAVLEEFLRDPGATDKPLVEKQGLADAAQKVDGMSTGFFAYENQQRSMELVFDLLKNGGEGLSRALPLNRLGPDADADAQNRFDPTDWLDPEKLPPFQQIAKYFSFAVYSGKSDSRGLSWQFFTPTPPDLR